MTLHSQRVFGKPIWICARKDNIGDARDHFEQVIGVNREFHALVCILPNSHYLKMTAMQVANLMENDDIRCDILRQDPKVLFQNIENMEPCQPHRAKA